MDRDIKPDWQSLSRRIKRRWDQLSDAELDQAKGNREYLLRKVHEHYGLARYEIDQELSRLGVGETQATGASLGSQGYAEKDNLAPPGSGLNDQGEAAGYAEARDASPADLEGTRSEVMRIGSEMDPRRNGAAVTRESAEHRIDPDPQDQLKDRGTATHSGCAAPLDQPRHRSRERRRGGERRS